MDNVPQPTEPSGPGRKRPTSWKLIVTLLLVGGVLAAGVFAAPRFFIDTPPPPSHPVLKTGGTSVVSVMVENRWRAKYLAQKGVRIDYASTGSTAGVEQLLNRKYDIAFTHAPAIPEQQNKAKEAGGQLLQVPVLICSVVPVYNLPALKGKPPLNFTGEVLGNIFLGKIKTWNHPDLTAINPNRPLPPTPITVVHRQESSGTTLLFTEYLSKASPSWREKFPRGGSSDPAWPAGEGAKRNLDLAVRVSQVDGAIGYVDLLYTHFRELETEYGAVQNEDKTAFLRPDRDTMTAAAEAALPDVREDLSLDVADRRGPKAYPISGVVYAVFFKSQPEATRARVYDFLHWATHEGQALTGEMSYAPLPGRLVDLAEQKLKTIVSTP